MDKISDVLLYVLGGSLVALVMTGTICGIAVLVKLTYYWVKDCQDN